MYNMRTLLNYLHALLSVFKTLLSVFLSVIQGHRIGTVLAKSSTYDDFTISEHMLHLCTNGSKILFTP